VKTHLAPTRLRRLLAGAVLAAAAAASLVVAAPAAQAAPAPATGTITGTFTDTTGVEADRIVVTAHTPRYGGPTYGGDYDASGRFTIPNLPPGRYQVEFSYSSDPTAGPYTVWVQWAHGAMLQSSATTFTVGAGETVVVDERGLPTGSMSITFRDAATGQGIQAFCASLSGAMFTTEGCTETGTVLLPVVRAGDYVVFISSDEGPGFGIADATVVDGQVAEVVAE
jgi:Carboxypeptidase regulatory-like domain